MKFSLVLSTVERTSEVRRFLDSLAAQDEIEVQLIVVDQNDDNRLGPILAAYRDRLPIQHLRSARGLSKARNVGLREVVGDVIAFPDDDCWYPEGLLATVQDFLSHHPEVDGITGRFTDGAGVSEGRWLSQSTDLSRYNIWRGAISFSIFLRQPVIAQVREFDETLGVGAGTPWGAAEETDFLLRGLEAGFRIRYLQTLVLRHPVKSIGFDLAAKNRQERYEAGIGRVIRKHSYPGWYFPAICMRTACGIAVAVLNGERAKARFKVAGLRGRLRGWLSHKK